MTWTCPNSQAFELQHRVVFKNNASKLVIRGPGLGVTLKIAIYNLHFATLGGGERSTCALAVHLAKKHNVAMFVNSPVSIATIKAIFGFDLSNIEIIPLEDRDHTAEIVRFDPDLFINNSHGSKLPNPARRGIYQCMFPDLTRIDLRTYHAVTANSQYTANWIARRWGCPSEVVYSACQNMGPPLPKAKIILNVAQFSDAQFGASQEARNTAESLQEPRRWRLSRLAIRFRRYDWPMQRR